MLTASDCRERLRANMGGAGLQWEYHAWRFRKWYSSSSRWRWRFKYQGLQKRGRGIVNLYKATCTPLRFVQFSSISRSPTNAFSPLDSQRIANVVIARNLNQASSQVQIQALEVWPLSLYVVLSWRSSAHTRKTELHKNCSTRRTKAFSVHCHEYFRHPTLNNASSKSQEDIGSVY